MFEDEKGLDEQANKIVEKGYMVLGQSSKTIPPVGTTGRHEWHNDYFEAAWLDEPMFLAIRMSADTFALDVDTDPKSGHATEAMETLEELWEGFLDTFPIDPVRTGANLNNSAGIYHFQMDGVTEQDIAVINVENLDVIRKGHRFAVIRGTHPTTGKAYRGELPQIDELPEFTPEMLAWWLERSAPKTYREPGAVTVTDMPALVPITDTERKRLDKYDCPALSERDWAAVGGRKRLLFGSVQRAAWRLSGSPVESMGKALAYIEPWVTKAYEHADRDKAKRYASVEHFWMDNPGLSECLEQLGKDAEGLDQGHPGTLRDGFTEGVYTLAEVLDEVAAFNRRFIYHKDDAVHDVIALWVAHTYSMESWNISPRLYINAPQPGVGKSTQGSIVQHLSLNGEKTASSTSAYIFGTINDNDGSVTLLLDESDNIWARGRDTSELQAIVNEGFQYGATVGRGNADQKAKVGGTKYLAYCPVAIIGIKNSMIPATTLSRCHNIKMTLPPAGHKRERFILRRHEPECAALRRKLQSVVQGISVDWDTLPPEFLENRDWDIWESLFAIAAAAGNDWVLRVERAARTLRGSTVAESPAQKVLRFTRDWLKEVKRATPTEIAEYINRKDEMFDLEGQRVSYYLRDHYDIESHKSNGQRVFRYEDVALAANEWLPHTPPQKPSLGDPVEDDVA